MRHLPYTLIVLAAATGFATAASTSYTDPVGYITVNVEGAASLNTFTAIAPTLVNKTEYQGVITSISASTIEVGGTPFTIGQFPATVISTDGNPGVEGFYVEIVSPEGGPPAAGEGAWTNITGTPTQNSITVADDMTMFAAIGSTIKIRKHVTVGEWLKTPAETGLVGGSDPGTADSVSIISPGDPTLTLFFDSGAGYWSDGDNYVNHTNTPIEPGQGGLVSRTQAATDTSWTFDGTVKTGKTMVSVLTGNNVVAVPLAAGLTLGTSLLEDNTAPVGVDGLNVGGDPGIAGDYYTVFDPNGLSVNTTYFYDDGSGYWSEDTNYGDETTKALLGGSALYITRAGAPFVWVAPAQVIATP